MKNTPDKSIAAMFNEVRLITILGFCNISLVLQKYTPKCQRPKKASGIWFLLSNGAEKINSVEFRCNWTMFCNWPIFQVRKLRLPHRKLFALPALKKRK